MNKGYFIEKLDELNCNNKSKIQNIIEILIKCEQYEEIIENKIKFLIQEHYNIIQTQKQVNDLFDSICNDLS